MSETTRWSLTASENEHDARTSEITDALGDAYCYADHIVGPDLDLTGVDASPYLQAHVIGLGHDLYRSAHGPGGGIEGGEEPVVSFPRFRQRSSPGRG